MSTDQVLADAANEVSAAAEEVRQARDSLENKVAEVDESVANAEQDYQAKAANLTIIATDGYKKAVESASGGRNTVVYDAQGNPNVMVVVPRFNVEDLGLTDLNLGVGTHPAFQTNGVPRGEILIGKYLASYADDGSAVVGGARPRTSVDYDQAKLLCSDKGQGWHMMSIHEWAAVALWSMANGTVPRGNTNYGRAHDAHLETATRFDGGQPGDMSGDGRTDTGKGPATWSHDHTKFGIADLVGNVFEWLDQMKLENGQIITTLDNDPSVSEANWHNHPAYFDSTSNATEIGNVGDPVLNTQVANRNGPLNDDSHDYAYSSVPNWASVTKDPSYTPVELLRRLLIESAVSSNAQGYLTVRNYGDRFPRRGAQYHGGSSAGLGSLHLANVRSYSNGNIGFRPALFV
ncbi:hypothetical protein HMF8227_02354 [Saliniradius amylolyticus]|uniref:Uncharacterized protein n=1 Tax=Saliniradius amylolyticus TaxID=2183582 RepID=A0A2S2E570_9ALTE|nr:SUMF1/EgtB/PvdO family nonheme iron enzyme [Saliniradius amylolyticus]AWL12806.1 hypothetical protein HMF8227_02354 [Saliniradius amylolyticus]